MSARLTPRDARMFWASSVIPSDQFLLYCFDHGSSPAPTARAVAALLAQRAESIPELRLRVSPAPLDLELPAWQSCDEVEVRERSTATWDQLRTAVAELFAEQVDAESLPWRLHVFPAVEGAPRCAGPATVVVLQVAHCLADGRRSADIARRLLRDDGVGNAPPGDPPPPDIVRAVRGLARMPIDLATTIWRGTRVDSARSQIGRQTETGALPPAVAGTALTALNTKPDDSRDVRILVLRRTDLAVAGHPVTVGALGAVSLAIERYLTRRGHPVPDAMNAEIMLARPPRSPEERNSFGNSSIPLFPGSPLTARLDGIAAAIVAARQRAASPLWRTIGAPDEAVPAFLAHRAVRSFDPDVRPKLMAGTTVLSSVNRGPADLELLGGRSVFTAGFPALSPAMGVTHGVNGLGPTVTVAVTSSYTALPDPVVYSDLLAEAFDELRRLA